MIKIKLIFPCNKANADGIAQIREFGNGVIDLEDLYGVSIMIFMI